MTIFGFRARMEPIMYYLTLLLLLCIGCLASMVVFNHVMHQRLRSFAELQERHRTISDVSLIISKNVSRLQVGYQHMLLASSAGDLSELLRPGVQVAIGHPDLGSVGKEAKRILEAKGIYDKVVAASAMMEPDSKALSAALRDGKVDVIINWKAVLHLRDNSQHMDAVPIEEGFATPHTLTMATLVFSRSPGLASQFLELCASAEGRAVFERYGF